MPDSMYSKLGNLLNDALESGEIPQKEEISKQKIINEKNSGCDNSEEVRDNSTLFNFKFNKQKKSTLGTIIKREKFSYIPNYPPQISQDLLFFGFDINEPVSFSIIKTRYKNLLKLNHPDKYNSDYSEQNTKMIIEAYNRLKNFFDN